MMCNTIRALIFAVDLGMATAAGGHSGAYEWAGIFDTPPDTYHWIAQKVNGAYADASMKLTAIPITTVASRAALAAAESEGKHSLNLTCSDVESGGEIVAKNEQCYRLIFNQSSPESRFIVKPNGAKAIAFFTEHVPTEFEDTSHYLVNIGGTDIEPVAQPAGMEGHHHGDGAGTVSAEEEFGRLCVCQSQKDGWKINCKDMKPVDAAILYLGKNEDKCLSLNPTAECKKQYHVLQAHHDHCLHDQLTKDAEKENHAYEAFYEDCSIKRQFDPKLSKCPAVTCETANLQTATDTLIRCDRTAAACAQAQCSTAIKTVLMSHDTCPEGVLPNNLELALHDHEESCEAQLCNSAPAAFDLADTICSALDVSEAPGGFGCWGPFLVTALAANLAVSFSS
jgi:hypothetical protein